MWARNRIHFNNPENQFAKKGNDFTMTGNFLLLHSFLQESDNIAALMKDFCRQKLNYAK